MPTTCCRPTSGSSEILPISFSKARCPFQPAKSVRLWPAIYKHNSHPSRPLRCKIISARSIAAFAGFRHAGYFRPSVNIQPDTTSGKILVSVDLGTRYQCGDIVVEGAKSVPVDQLTKRLKQPKAHLFFNNKIDQDSVTVDMDSGEQLFGYATWVVGDPAPFDDSSAAMLSDHVRLAMAGLGYFHPELEVAVAPAGKTATLSIPNS